MSLSFRVTVERQNYRERARDRPSVGLHPKMATAWGRDQAKARTQELLPGLMDAGAKHLDHLPLVSQVC